MSKENKFFASGLASLVILAVYVLILCKTALGSFVTELIPGMEHWYCLLALILLNVFFAVKSKKFFPVFVSSLFLVMTYLSFAENSYSPIDEYPNFESINHIVSTNTLPTFSDDVDSSYLAEVNHNVTTFDNNINYEAVQAPLFYILFALIGKLIPDAYVRFHTFRLISLMLVLVVYYFISRSVRYLKEKEIITVDEELYRLSLCLTIFNPAYLYRASRLNNEILVCVFMAALLYISLRCLNEGYSRKYYILLSLLCVALFLTKNTAVYAYIIFGILVIMQKKLKEAVLPVFASALLTVPWFAFNIRTYGTLTAMSHHLDFVIPIVNPAKTNVDIIDALFVLMPRLYFSAEEATFAALEQVFSGAFFLLTYFFVGYVIYLIIKEFAQKKFDFESYDIAARINIICAAMLGACCAVLIAGTISTKICSIRGRYIYAASVALVIMCLVNRKVLSGGAKCLAMILSLTAFTFSAARVSFQSLTNAFTNEQLFGSHVSRLELCSLTDDNWLNGYSRTDNILLLEVSPDNTDNYGLLTGRRISNRNGSAVITRVSDIMIFDGISYIWLYTSNAMTPDVESTVISLGENVRSISYNSNKLKIVNELLNIEGSHISQSLKVKDNCEIWGIEMIMATHCVPDYNAELYYSLADADNNIIGSGTVFVDNMADNSAVKIYFDGPISVRKDEQVTLELDFDNSSDQLLAVYSTTNDEYEEGELFINGAEQKDIDMGFRLLTFPSP